MKRWIAVLGFVALIALHLDFWREQRAVLWFGWLPEELAYRAAWMALAWVYMLFLCSRVWRSR